MFDNNKILEAEKENSITPTQTPVQENECIILSSTNLPAPSSSTNYTPNEALHLIAFQSDNHLGSNKRSYMHIGIHMV